MSLSSANPEHEVVICEATTHMIAYAKGYAILAGGVLLFIAGLWQAVLLMMGRGAEHSAWAEVLLLLAIVTGAFGGFLVLIKRARNRPLRVTNQSINRRYWNALKQGKEAILLRSIQSMQVEQSWLGRQLNYGDLVIRTWDRVIQHANLRDPHRVMSEIKAHLRGGED